MALLKLWHVVFVGLFAGAQLSMLAIQSLLWRSLDDADRRSIARLASTAGRVLVVPVMYLAWLSGLAYWAEFHFRGPPYIHVMFACGTLAVGLSSMWKARARKLSEALEKGTAITAARPHLVRGFVFAALALAFSLAAFVVAILKVPAGHG